MSAMWYVELETKARTREGMYLSSADARSFKKSDIRAARIKAREKAKARWFKKTGERARVTYIRCVG